MKLTLVDFKNHTRKIVELEGVTEVSGRNGVGKTAVLEAIVYAYYGRNMVGGLGTDQYIRKGSLSATVLLEEAGRTIKRSSSLTGEGTVFINGAKARASELTASLPPIEQALAVINPLYFMTEMSATDRRSLFMKLYPQRDRVEVFREKYSEDEEFIERFKLSDIQGLRKQKRGLEQAMVANEALIGSNTIELEKMKAHRAELLKDTGYSPKGVLMKEKEKQQQINEIDAKLSRLGNPVEDIKKYELELKDHAAMLKPTLRKYEVSSLSELKKFFDDKMSTLTADEKDISDRASEASHLLKQYEGFVDGVCPVCGSKVEEQRSKAVELTEELKHLRATYSEVVEKRERLQRAIDQLAEVEEAVQASKGALDKAKKALKPYNTLVKKRDALKSQLVGLSEEEFKKAVEVEAKRREAKLMVDRMASVKTTITGAKNSNKKIALELEGLEVLIRACSPQGVEADLAIDTAKRLESELSEVLGRKVRIVTVRKNRTNDNVKEVFDIYIDKVRFNDLSFGERILVSAGLGLVARGRMSGFPFPFVMLDEASVLSKDTLDSLTKMVTSAGLDFYYTRAFDGDFTLTNISSSSNGSD